MHICKLTELQQVYHSSYHNANAHVLALLFPLQVGCRLSLKVRGRIPKPEFEFDFQLKNGAHDCHLLSGSTEQLPEASRTLDNRHLKAHVGGTADSTKTLP